jgi:hypothetical protein
MDGASFAPIGAPLRRKRWPPGRPRLPPAVSSKSMVKDMSASGLYLMTEERRLSGTSTMTPQRTDGLTTIRAIIPSPCNCGSFAGH